MKRIAILVLAVSIVGCEQKKSGCWLETSQVAYDKPRAWIIQEVCDEPARNPYLLDPGKVQNPPEEIKRAPETLER